VRFFAFYHTIQSCGSGGSGVIKDTKLLAYFKAIDTMPDDTKDSLLKVIDAYVRDYKTKKAYA